MRTSFLPLLLLVLASNAGLARADSNGLAAAKAEILPLFDAMEAAANAHDSEKHVGFYARDADLHFVVNDREIVGWDALLEQQRKWWLDGKSDVVYTLAGPPEFQMPAPGLVLMTYFLTSHRTMPDGAARDSRFGISAVWQKRPEGWRIIQAHESVVNK